jgi:hypothetical protein
MDADLAKANWRKSTRSNGSGGDCTSCASFGAQVLVRDTKLGDSSPILAFSPQAWHRFIDETKTA